jgi:Mg/Co/Ni transporter MgtE
MLNDYLPLRSFSLAKNTAYCQPAQVLPERVKLSDPAVNVMTDLRQITTLTIPELATVQTAQDKMRRRNVHMLFVVNEANVILGLITTTDILGEKPVRTGKPHDEILVKDIMTPQDRVEVLDMEDVRHAKVGHIVASMQKYGRTHALAVEILEPARMQMVRGIFSLSQISRQLGVTLYANEVARTFSEINEALAR